ncbi:MAG: HEPN domain-containing protein [Candidatus Sulfobium sp.]
MKDTLKEVLKGYMENARKKLAVAERLLESGDYDDAVSRAYYAAFHAAQALLLTEGERAETQKGVSLKVSPWSQSTDICFSLLPTRPNQYI